MEKGRVARVVIVALTLPAWVGVSRASELAEARPGAKVRVTTAQAPGVVAGQPPTAQGGVPSTGPGRSLSTADLAILGTLVELDRDTITVLRQSEKDRIR